MGISDLLPCLPGGGPNSYHHWFYESGLGVKKEVPLDAAGSLWQYAASHAADFLRGNYDPALVEWTCLLNYLRSIC